MLNFLFLFCFCFIRWYLLYLFICLSYNMLHLQFCCGSGRVRGWGWGWRWWGWGWGRGWERGRGGGNENHTTNNSSFLQFCCQKKNTKQKQMNSIAVVLALLVSLSSLPPSLSLSTHQHHLSPFLPCASFAFSSGNFSCNTGTNTPLSVSDSTSLISLKLAPWLPVQQKR